MSQEGCWGLKAGPVGMERGKWAGHRKKVALRSPDWMMGRWGGGGGGQVESEARLLTQDHRSEGRVGKTRLSLVEDTNNSVFWKWLAIDSPTSWF